MLNNETINKIAAGEVIIRPVSVVKELVENSIDAGASHITVIIEAGGKNLITVRDNGGGIAYNDIPLAFKRHATSKLSTIEDLETIDSLGFRGEALSSVAAVAKVQVTTRNEQEEVGSRTVFEASSLVNQRVCSYNQGTEIKVWDLFYNVPARRKHLEKDKKEEGLIRDLMNKIALSHPGIKFQVTCNGRSVLDTPGSGKLIDVINVLYGWEMGKNLIALDYENKPMKLSGFVGNLKTMRNHREDQIFFINGRYVKNNRLAQSLDEAYGGYAMKHQHPLGIIFIELPGRMLDVNIHPAKTEIKILNESLVGLLFKQGIRETLKNANLIVDLGTNDSLSEEPIPETKSGDSFEKIEKKDNLTEKISEKNHSENQATIGEVLGKRTADSSAKKADRPESQEIPPSPIPQSRQRPEVQEKEKKKFAKKDEILTMENKTENQKENYKEKNPKNYLDKQAFVVAAQLEAQHRSRVAEAQTEFHREAIRTPSAKEQIRELANMKIVGQLFNVYILLEGQKEIFLLDQHAAHEAFLSAELEEIFKKEKMILSQGLMTPIPIKIRPKDLDHVESALEFYKKLGYECDIFGEDTLLVRSVPVLMGDPQSIDLLKDIIDENIFDTSFFDLDEVDPFAGNALSAKVKNRIIAMACKAAIKGGQQLSNSEIRQLLENLQELDNPYTCPHGRPIIMRLKEYELMKLFKRVT